MDVGSERGTSGQLPSVLPVWLRQERFKNWYCLAAVLVFWCDIKSVTSHLVESNSMNDPIKFCSSLHWMQHCNIAACCAIKITRGTVVETNDCIQYSHQLNQFCHYYNLQELQMSASIALHGTQTHLPDRVASFLEKNDSSFAQGVWGKLLKILKILDGISCILTYC